MILKNCLSLFLSSFSRNVIRCVLDLLTESFIYLSSLNLFFHFFFWYLFFISWIIFTQYIVGNPLPSDFLGVVKTSSVSPIVIPLEAISFSLFSVVSLGCVKV